MMDAMQAVRTPAVAGSFYPANAAELRGTVLRLLAAAAPGAPPKALIAPHAGYVYSGPIAASAFRRIENAPFTRVVLLGPSHFTHLHGVAVPGAAAMRTPLGDIPVEDSGLPHNPRAHSLEHSLEVELPFLQLSLSSFTLAPLAVGEATPEEVAAVLERLWGGPETLIVISSDLSHYLPYADAQKADAASAKEILALGHLRRDDACGAVPINGLLVEARRRGVDVRIMVSGVHNDNWLARQNSVRLFGPLLRAGIEIYDFNRTMLHHKTMVVDGQWTTIGTTNFDNRSFSHNEENNICCYDVALARQLQATFEEDMKGCARVTLDAWRRRGALRRTGEILAAFLEEQI